MARGRQTQPRSPSPAAGVTVTAKDLATAQVGEFEFEASTQCWSWSPSVFDIMGVSAALQPSTALLMATKHPDDRRLTRRAIGKAPTSHRLFHHQSRVVRADGQLRTLETSGTIVLAPNGTPGMLFGTVAVVSGWTVPAFDKALADGLGEGSLWVALAARIEAAHTYVFCRNVEMVRRASGQLLSNREQIDDVAQSVFEDLWHHPRRFDPSRGSLATYLRLQARSRSIDLLRSESARSRREAPWIVGAVRTADYEDEFAGTLSRVDVRHALDLLPACEKAPIELAYFEGMTYRAVATHLGVPEGTVKSRIRSGLLRLRNVQDAEA
jgi:RNA polymerase sigma-70 factor, ECF subfamily